MEKYIYNHNSQETAFVVEDYPWGFRLRTKIRYWVETKDTKNGGQRLASQTVNPKTGVWCAPKYSTYRPIMVMFLDENDYVRVSNLDQNDSKEDMLEFKEKHLNHLTDYQKKRLKEILGFAIVMEKVSFKFTAGSLTEEELQKQKEITRNIGDAIRREIASVKL